MEKRAFIIVGRDGSTEDYACVPGNAVSFCVRACVSMFLITQTTKFFCRCVIIICSLRQRLLHLLHEDRGRFFFFFFFFTVNMPVQYVCNRYPFSFCFLSRYGGNVFHSRHLWNVAWPACIFLCIFGGRMKTVVEAKFSLSIPIVPKFLKDFFVKIRHFVVADAPPVSISIFSQSYFPESLFC